MLNKKIKENCNNYVLIFLCSWNKDALYGVQFGVDRAAADLAFGLIRSAVGLLIWAPADFAYGLLRAYFGRCGFCSRVSADLFFGCLRSLLVSCCEFFFGADVVFIAFALL